MNSNYNKEEWAAITDIGRQIYNYNYHLSGNQFKGWKLIKMIVLTENKELTEKTYMFESAADPKHEIIRIDIVERNGWDLAQESLLQSLLEKMRTDIPKGTGELKEIGDVNYVAREQKSDIPAAISFTRGNLLLSINCVGDRNFDVTGIADQIDNELHKAPTAAKQKTDKIRTLKPTEVTVRAQEQYSLIRNLKKLAPRKMWLKIIVPDGELKRKGEDLIYISPTEGKKRVNIFATNRD
jgi:hypothetical protein